MKYEGGTLAVSQTLDSPFTLNSDDEKTLQYGRILINKKKARRIQCGQKSGKKRGCSARLLTFDSKNRLKESNT